MYVPFERPFFLIIPAEGEPCLVVPLLEVSHAAQRTLIEMDYHTYYEIGRIAYASKVTGIGMKKALSLAQPGPSAWRFGCVHH